MKKFNSYEDYVKHCDENAPVIWVCRECDFESTYEVTECTNCGSSRVVGYSERDLAEARSDSRSEDSWRDE